MELIIEDAEFVTMAGADPAQAMLVRDGRIAAMGPAGAVRAAAAPGARVARLDGATVIPGLIDAHCHVCDVGYLAAAADCSQPSAPDIPAIQARLRERGVGTGVHYPVPVHLQPAYAGRVALGPSRCVATERAAAEVLSLPMWPELTDDQVEAVCGALTW